MSKITVWNCRGFFCWLYVIKHVVNIDRRFKLKFPLKFVRNTNSYIILKTPGCAFISYAYVVALPSQQNFLKFCDIHNINGFRNNGIDNVSIAWLCTQKNNMTPDWTCSPQSSSQATRVRREYFRRNKGL